MKQVVTTLAKVSTYQCLCSVTKCIFSAMGSALQHCFFDPPVRRCCRPCCCCLPVLDKIFGGAQNGEEVTQISLQRAGGVIETLKTASGDSFDVWSYRREHWDADVVTRGVHIQGERYMHLPEPGFNLVYSHGRTEDITLSALHRILRSISHAQNVNVWLYDWPGYGLSTGEPSEQSTIQAASAAFEHITCTDSGRRVVMMGHSLGVGVAVVLPPSICRS